MGTVYMARQLSLNRYVAIKILPDVLAKNAGYVERFKFEAMAAARLKHSNIVQIYDFGMENAFHFLVMEFINGETTGQRVRRKERLDEESALLIGESVAVALDHAWRLAKLVHRDIKPDNIMIDEDGTVKVADLGLAKMVSESARHVTLVKTMLGTPHYCSPEQARGLSEVDFRADIYALGATLYHFVVGQAPFSETPGLSAMVRNITDFIPDPREFNPSVSESFVQLLEIMMAKDRDDRQNSWARVLSDIDCVLKKGSLTHARLPARASTIHRGLKKPEYQAAEGSAAGKKRTSWWTRLLGRKQNAL
ncbi:MAG: serine/threonine protein kinase [Lentisphaerae bacterium]|nr:serine/threonine protein kinase [Lentisphaerota bacterium]